MAILHKKSFKERIQHVRGFFEFFKIYFGFGNGSGVNALGEFCGLENFP